MKNLIPILALTIVGCAKEEKFFDRNAKTPSFVVKDQELYLENRMEATPFYWNGTVHMMSSHRQNDTSPHLTGEIEIFDHNKNLISSTPTPIKFASAIVENGDLVVIGTYKNQVLISKSSDLLDWSEPKVVLPEISGRTLYNTSVIKKANGTFLMALETCEPGTACFNVRFFESPDLESWSEAGEIFSPNEYAACPTIREIDGEIYMFYLRDVGHYATYIAKSSDLKEWTISPQVVISALNTEGEENNASDFDLIEEGGTVRINYAIGNQLTYSHIKIARYQGTLNQFVKEFFK